MIDSRKKYNYYVKKDEMVNFGGEGHRPFYIGDEIKKYLKLLRKREYIEFLAKEKENIFFSLYNVYLKRRL